jgi:hypothetical protein
MVLLRNLTQNKPDSFQHFLRYYKKDFNILCLIINNRVLPGRYQEEFPECALIVQTLCALSVITLNTWALPVSVRIFKISMQRFFALRILVFIDNSIVFKKHSETLHMSRDFP